MDSSSFDFSGTVEVVVLPGFLPVVCQSETRIGPTDMSEINEPQNGEDVFNAQERQSSHRLPWHSLVGRFSATVVTLLVSRPIVRTWLHSGLRLAEVDESQPHLMHLYIGRQESVSPALFGQPIRFPFCYDYPEIIAAVPDLEVQSHSIPILQKPVTYLAHLFLGAWGPTVLGRGIYMVNKSYARIEMVNGCVRALTRHGRRLLDAHITPVPLAPVIPLHEGLRRNPTCYLSQPLVVGRRGKLKLARMEFLDPLVELAPVHVSLDMAAGFVSWMPEIRCDVPGIHEVDSGAFQFQSGWRLTSNCKV